MNHSRKLKILLVLRSVPAVIKWHLLLSLRFLHFGIWNLWNGISWKLFELTNKQFKILHHFLFLYRILSIKGSLLPDKFFSQLSNYTTMGLDIFFLYTAFHYKNQHHQLCKDEKRRRDRRTKRVALRYYRKSSFYYLFCSGNDQSLLNCFVL